MWWIRWFLQYRLERVRGHLLFFSGGLYFVGSDLYRIGTINRELIASTFGRPPGWSVSQEVFAASSRLSTLKADYNSEVQGLLFFSALICFFTNWISHESDSILFGRKTICHKSPFFVQTPTKDIFRKLASISPMPYFRDNALLCKHQCWSDLACIGKKMMQVHNTQEGTTNHRETQKVVWFVGQKGGCVWRE